MKKLMAILLSLTLACAAVLPALAEGKKDETVYVLANPDGSARRVIVSDYLSNPDGADTIADVSNLEKIQNVKGDEAFADGVWQAKGNEIYYQGDSSEALPVELKISATLDGTEIAPADLAGRSGHVTLRFDYAVSASYTKDAETVAMPFAVITGALLDNEVFANVSVKNGQAVNDGDRTVAVGLCVPGLTTGLKLESDKVELPEYLEISADVKNFSLPVTVTLATNEAFAAQFLGTGAKLKENHGWEIDLEKTNVNGSGISLGHPIGCTGLRIIVSMLYEMERRGATVGGASLCVGGGPAMASLWTKKMD